MLNNPIFLILILYGGENVMFYIALGKRGCLNEYFFLLPSQKRFSLFFFFFFFVQVYVLLTDSELIVLSTSCGKTFFRLAFYSKLKCFVLIDHVLSEISYFSCFFTYHKIEATAQNWSNLWNLYGRLFFLFFFIYIFIFLFEKKNIRKYFCFFHRFWIVNVS